MCLAGSIHPQATESTQQSINWERHHAGLTNPTYMEKVMRGDGPVFMSRLDSRRGIVNRMLIVSRRVGFAMRHSPRERVVPKKADDWKHRFRCLS